MVFGMAIGCLYFLFGLIQIIVGFGFSSRIMDALLIPTDIIGGFILILLGSVFMYGVKELKSGISEGVAYIYVGIFLAVIFLVIYLLIMAADAVEAYVILNEDYMGWTPYDAIKPGIYLGIIPLAALVIWRAKFSLS